MLAIVVDPASKSATEIAVRNGDVAGTGRLIPVGNVVRAVPERVDVDLSRSGFFSLDRFLVPNRSAASGTHDPAPDAPAWSDVWLIRPGTLLFAEHENVPNGEVSIRRGMHVLNASGHRIGSVEGWNFHPTSGKLASLLFVAHPLFHRHRMLIDASSVESIDKDGVRLTLSAADLDDLEPMTK